jgi:PhnB protein
MQFNPYLHFPGNCEEAFNLYAKAFGATISDIHRFGQSPMANQVPAEWQSKVMHVSLTVNGQTLMGSDASPDRYRAPQGFSVSINLADAGEAERIFNQLATGGFTQMPLQKTFWAERFGMCTDRFGIPWMVNCHQPQ